jgi:hypothetical protein
MTGVSSTAKFHREDGVEARRDLDGGGEDMEFRQKKGVRPVVDGEEPGSENLTRFFFR